jgi:hypothetical protein
VFNPNTSEKSALFAAGLGFRIHRIIDGRAGSLEVIQLAEDLEFFYDQLGPVPPNGDQGNILYAMRRCSAVLRAEHHLTGADYHSHVKELRSALQAPVSVIDGYVQQLLVSWSGGVRKDVRNLTEGS